LEALVKYYVFKNIIKNLMNNFWFDIFFLELSFRNTVQKNIICALKLHNTLPVLCKKGLIGTGKLIKTAFLLPSYVSQAVLPAESRKKKFTYFCEKF
jgi:hypothetical protein